MKPLFQLTLLIIALVEIYSLIPYQKKGLNRGDSFSITDNMDNQPYLLGAIHVHSNYGSGSGTVEDLTRAANRAKLNFVVVTDLDNLEAQRKGLAKSYDGTDAYIEMEATTPAGHLLVFYSHTESKDFSEKEVAKIGWNHFLGAKTIRDLFTVTAHPSNLKTPWNRLDKFPDGVEVINFDSLWRRELDDSAMGFVTTLFLYPFNQYLSIMRFSNPNEKDFATWDSMNELSFGHFGIIGHNTRAKIKINQSSVVAWPSYFQSFKVAANVVYLTEPVAKDFETRKKQIYASLKEGRIAMAFHYLYPFNGNDWEIQCDEKSFRIGSQFTLGQSKCLHKIRIPQGFPYSTTVKVFRNGQLVSTISGQEKELTAKVEQSGSYRVEVWAHIRTSLRLLQNTDAPYIFYNPIYVH